MNNTGVTGLKPPQKDFEHARGPRNSAYAVNLTYDRHTPTYRQHTYISREISIEHPSVGLASLAQLPVMCVVGSVYVTGSAKRYVVALTMIFLYKRCCSKTRSIFYSLKKNFFWLSSTYLQLFAYHLRQI